MQIASIRKFTAIYVLLYLLLACPGKMLAQEPGEIKVSLEINNEPLHKALDRLSSTIGYYFTYDSRLVDSQQKITASFNELPLAQVIDSLFPGPPLSLRRINNNIVLLAEISSDPDSEDALVPEDRAWYEIKGTILDQRNGKKLPFATIAVYNTSLGTISNEDGSFLLRISDSIAQPILVASYIGYKDHYMPVAENNREPVEIMMHKQLISLQEVIIRYEDPQSLLQESI